LWSADTSVLSMLLEVPWLPNQLSSPMPFPAASLKRSSTISEFTLEYMSASGVGVEILLVRVEGAVGHRAFNIAGGDGDGAGLQVGVRRLYGVGDAAHHHL
jgi:hypothetical protein